MVFFHIVNFLLNFCICSCLLFTFPPNTLTYLIIVILMLLSFLISGALLFLTIPSLRIGYIFVPLHMSCNCVLDIGEKNSRD